MTYDVIVVGSGNGACGFLSHYLKLDSEQSPIEKVVVIEEGDDFFNTSDITHQNNWTKSYAEGNIFKLHKAKTPDGIPIISGWACTMGGGGSINYTMIHESSEWLAQNIGRDKAYWDSLKAELNQKFLRENPTKNLSPVTKTVIKAAEEEGFHISTDTIENIPNYREGNTNWLHIFPTQFNFFGQRTNSGVSLVNWFDQSVEIKTRCRVVKLELTNDPEDKARCVGIYVQYLDTDKKEFLPLSDNGKLIMCAGAATPKLLWLQRERLENAEIGRYVSDHIVLPLGVYVPDKKIDVTPKDVYVPVFATTVWQPEAQGKPTVCCFDFFAGDFEKLWFIISHLYLTFLLPNWLKKIVIQVPLLFYITKNFVRILIQLVNFFINLWMGISNTIQGKPWDQELELITAIVKFNPAMDGYYSGDGSEITLGFFTEDKRGVLPSSFNQDKEVAKSVIKKQLALLNRLGQKPHWLFKFVFRLFTKIPYEPEQVERYVDVYSRKFLLSEQHLAGGCLFNKAIDTGMNNVTNTGKLYGSANVYIADLSTVPLPRISPQMTAYIIGFHVAKSLKP
ncbi:GMC family oxidoreductase N-terminal domain-containing protein [Richelia sinica]|nr:GMC family oxidoreductase N-terminal domain-containing protein [Richelia sinica]MBD2667033.1 GMC family oxidoreductase N-terminal domain-containing protein [Richelia sinica FACHB-800]